MIEGRDARKGRLGTVREGWKGYLWRRRRREKLY